MSQANYIFLDNWVLSNYTLAERIHLLSAFLNRNRLTILFDSLSLVELYNPKGRPGDRVSRAARFLEEHDCVIVDPEKVFRAELMQFPEPLRQLPVELDLKEIAPHKGTVLESILRRDAFFLRQRKDIAEWAAGYQELKDDWLSDVDRIIAHACAEGVLHRDRHGKLVDLESSKEKFLCYLDRRHFLHLSREENVALGANLIHLFLGETKQLPAIRLTSLCFWYAYIETDKAFPMKRNGSDIGDFYQISMLAYCAAFTADKTMCRLLSRLQDEIPHTCKILNRQDLEKEIAM